MVPRAGFPALGVARPEYGRHMNAIPHLSRWSIAAAVVGSALGASGALGVSVDWAQQSSGAAGAYTTAWKLAALPDGSALATGTVEGADSSFGPFPIVNPAYGSAFVAKAGPSGFAWATQPAGPTNAPGGVAAWPDGSSAISGYYFDGSLQFGSTTLQTANHQRAYIAKLNPDGTFAWAIQPSGSGTSGASGGVSGLPDGSMIVTGPLSGAITLGGQSISSTSGTFVAKVNADSSVAWASATTDSGRAEPTAVAAAPDGSSIITGWFWGSVGFGSTTLTSVPGDTRAFIAKVNANGAFAWAVKVASTGDSYARGAAVLPDGSVRATGTFTGSATVGTQALANGGANEGFVVKVNGDGSVAWATQASGTGAADGSGITAFSDGSSVVTGSLAGTMTFGSTAATASASSVAYLAGLDASGNYTWVLPAGGAGASYGRGVAARADGSVVAGGLFMGPMTLGTAALTPTGAGDGYVASITPGPPPAPSPPAAIGGDGRATVTVTALGGSVTSYLVTAAPGGRTCTITSPATSCDVDGLTNGTTYTFTARATNSQGMSGPSLASAPVTPGPQGSAPAASPGTGLAPTTSSSARETRGLSVTVQPSRTRIVSGRVLRLGVRVRNAGSAPVAGVSACLLLSGNLVPVAPRVGRRSTQAPCVQMPRIAPGREATRVILVRAVSSRRALGRIAARATAAGDLEATAPDVAVRIRPRPERA